MKNILFFVFLGIAMLTCTREEEDIYFTIKGSVTVVNDSESEGTPLAGIQVFIVETECMGECFLCSPRCNFVQNLAVRDMSDDSGQYSISFLMSSRMSYNADIVVPEGYRLIRSGGEEKVTVNNTFEHFFVLKPLD